MSKIRFNPIEKSALDHLCKAVDHLNYAYLIIHRDRNVQPNKGLLDKINDVRIKVQSYIDKYK